MNRPATYALEFHKKSEFIQTTTAGVMESPPHEVKITKEAPNYQIPEILILKSNNQTTITFFTLIDESFNLQHSQVIWSEKALADINWKIN